MKSFVVGFIGIVLSVAMAAALDKKQTTQPVEFQTGGRELKEAPIGPPALTSGLAEVGAGVPASHLATIASRSIQDAAGASRSAKDVALYRSISPSVVLVATKTGLGSGVLISNTGDIITNWHVVNGYSLVAVVFKPSKEGTKPSSDNMKLGQVVKVDAVRDLALVKVAEMPADRKPIRLGEDSDIAVGVDVHAIGHPDGQQWTYTNGIISQYRRDFAWSGDEDKIKHKADVIQTQTPINPGNSGGPLLSDSGALLGINSFKVPNTEGLSFAVSVADVRRFVVDTSQEEDQKSGNNCELKEISRARNKNNDATVVSYDKDCSGKTNAQYIVPDKKEEAILLSVDRNDDGKTDVVFFDLQRRGKWDLSYWDAKFEGRWTLVGYHSDGSLKPTRFESYDDYRKKVASRR